ncbi:MAG: type III PLP-dependent enzyme [Rhodospirillaceae bacterium]
MTEKILQFLRENAPESPCLIVDVDRVIKHYQDLNKFLPGVEIYYAIKANPAKEILMALLSAGSNFDAASIFEIRQCLAAGIVSSKISFGNTIKKEAAIIEAFEAGVDLYAVDCESEVQKIARSAPGARVFCRFLTSGAGADWPLSNKFGIAPDGVIDVLLFAKKMGLNPVGLSFHVGSQQRDLAQWVAAITQAADLFSCASRAGLGLDLLNIGGGFPSSYRNIGPTLQDTCDVINDSILRGFGGNRPRLIAEPGRFIAGDAGMIEAEVVLVSKKREGGRRWVYLDIGKFGGLIETMGEAIKYKIETSKDGEPLGPVVIAGPTCDEMDVLYETSGYELPLSLEEGDKIRILNAGAYTASYSSTGFNGFPPLREFYI